MSLFHSYFNKLENCMSLRGKLLFSKRVRITFKNIRGWGDGSVCRVLALQAQVPGFDPQHPPPKKRISNRGPKLEVGKSHLSSDFSKEL